MKQYRIIISGGGTGGHIFPMNIIMKVTANSRIAVDPLLKKIRKQTPPTPPKMYQNICLSVNQFRLLRIRSTLLPAWVNRIRNKIYLY